MTPIKKLRDSINYARMDPNMSNIKQIQQALKNIKPLIENKKDAVIQDEEGYISEKKKIPQELKKMEMQIKDDLNLLDKITDICLDSIKTLKKLKRLNVYSSIFKTIPIVASVISISTMFFVKTANDSQKGGLVFIITSLLVYILNSETIKNKREDMELKISKAMKFKDELVKRIKSCD